MKKQISPEQALSRLQSICAASEQCSYDLTMKMRRWNILPSVADKIIRSLKEQHFVDDERFARAYTRHAYRFSKWGKAKISSALIAKHIPRDIISSAIDEEIDAEEYAEIAMSILSAKVRSLRQPASYENRARLYRFMSSRGYETRLTSKLLDDIFHKMATSDDQSLD